VTLNRHLRVLTIEASEPDSFLLRRYLERAGYEIVMHRAATAEAMRAALREQRWDVILADYSLPQFGSLQALSVLKETGLDIPFIIISGAIGEELVVNAMLAGADDYLMKDNLARLVPAIERELQKISCRSARRQTDEALKASEAELRAVFTAMSDLIMVLDAEGRCLRIAPNEASAVYPTAEMIGKTAHDLYTQGKADFFLEHIRRTLVQQRPHRVEYSFGKRDNVVWFEGAVAPMSADRVIWIARDITERKRAEEALRASEERYRLLFESYPDPTYVFDLDTLRFIAINQAMVRCYGYTREEFLSMKVTDIWPSVEVSAQFNRLAQLESSVRQEKEWKHRRKDGTIFDVEITSHPLFVSGKRTCVVQAQDVTAQKSLEEQLRQSQRMDALGQLAGGIAHDFNNLLTIINGYSDLVLDQLPPDEPMRKNLEEIQKAGLHAAALTTRLLAFSRKQPVQPSLLRVNTVVMDLEKMLYRLIGEDVELRTILEPYIGCIKADHGQIEQVIMNLAVNARDAMPDGGKLTIKTANVDLDEEYARRHIGVIPGPYVLLSVIDNGSGMDAQTQARIFEPFFTTKRPGKGTGLGLSTVYAITTQWGGHISLESELGKGASFNIYLPRVDGGADLQRDSAKGANTSQGTETILLVEDDETVRSLAVRVLERYGYRVLEAANGDAAVLVVLHYPETIDLLITDMVMPEMNGIELFKRLTELRKNLKVLYISGYTDNAHMRPFVQKPFTLEGLVSSIREVLDSVGKT
jgi:two-component system cell cycle sensor histidine kinase/response regulator CckA